MKFIYWFMTLHLRIRKLLGASTAGLSLVSVVPGVGIFAAVWRALKGICTAFFEGISVCVSNPVVLTVVAVAYAGGVWQGIRWDLHKVRVANAKVQEIQQQWKAAEDAAERRLAGAMAARKTAEEAAKAESERAAAAASAAARAAADARRMRDKLGKQSDASGGGQGMSWLSTLFPPDGQPAAKR